MPLILTGHGVSLRIEGSALTIRNGFTHYPQKQETYRFFKGELVLPERIIMLDGSGASHSMFSRGYPSSAFP